MYCAVEVWNSSVLHRAISMKLGIVVVSYVFFCVGFSSGKGTHIDLGRAIGLPGLFANYLSHGPWNYQAVNLLGVCALVLYRPG